MGHIPSHGQEVEEGFRNIAKLDAPAWLIFGTSSFIAQRREGERRNVVLCKRDFDQGRRRALMRRRVRGRLDNQKIFCSQFFRSLSVLV